jgi:hypothetical protein
MSIFMIRVELHQARTAEQYQRLHQQLSRFGINNIIVADNGVRYRLPPAEYCYSGNATRDQLLQAAKQCAASVDPSFAVVVTESTGVAWAGLAAA